VGVADELTVLGRKGTAQDIADAVQFLIGNLVSDVAGHVPSISGGYRS